MSQTAPPHLLVLTTCPDSATAEKLARLLVEQGRAACVNITGEAHSVYRWQGKVESATERLLIIKTTAAGFAAVRDTIKANHPYELPEVIAVPVVAGLAEYLDWIEQGVESA